MGMINLVLSYNRVRLFGTMPASIGEVFLRIAIMMRWVIIIGVLFLAFYIEMLDMLSVAVGIILPHILTVIDYAIYLVKKKDA